MSSDWNPLLYTGKHSFVFEFGAGLISLLAPQPGERILDIGCGTGQLTAQIADSGAVVTGIDGSEEMVAEARQAFPGIDFQVQDVADFSFDQPFDAIFSNAVLHWVLDKEAAIACMYRALKPGGRVVAEFGGKGNVQTIESQLRRSLSQRGLLEQAALELWYFPSPGEYIPLLERQGFEVRLVHYYDRPTELADSGHGIEDWLDMFCSAFFEEVDEALQAEIKQEVQEQVREKIYRKGKWYADYKRLRFVAIKK